MKHIAYVIAGATIIGLAVVAAGGINKGQKVSDEAAAVQQLNKAGAHNVKLGDAVLIKIGTGKYAYMRDVDAR